MTLELTEVTKSYTLSPSIRFNAVENISLYLESGSSTAVIGPNGAGKSTLLRLVAGITAPTSGLIRRSSRCASLIELGAGFHPDLTAQENLDLGLGMAGYSRAERRNLHDGVVDFAGLGDAMSLPLKHLSTGMLARLACSIAIHSEPDILLVDEVLAVGDAVFQRSLLQRVGEMVHDGITLVLVTHSLELAEVASERAVWLDGGRMVEEGPTPGVLQRYAEFTKSRHRHRILPELTIRHVALKPERISPGDSLTAVLEVECSGPVHGLSARVEVRPVVGEGSVWMRSPSETADARRLNLVACSAPLPIGDLAAGRHVINLHTPSVPISRSLVEVSVVILDTHHRIADEVSLDVAIGTEPIRPQFHLEASTNTFSDN